MRSRVLVVGSILVLVAVASVLVIANLPGGRSFLVEAFGIRPGQDVTGHFWVMGLMSGALVALSRTRSVTLPGWSGIALAFVIASLDEALQIRHPARAASWSDWRAGVAGVLLVGGFAWAALAWVERKRGRAEVR